MRKWCNICPFLCNEDKITIPKQSIKTTDRFTCTTANAIYCILHALYAKRYTWVKQGGDWVTVFCEHLQDVERNDKDASKPVARHFNLPDLSSQHMKVCSLSLHQGNKGITVKTSAFNFSTLANLPC